MNKIVKTAFLLAALFFAVMTVPAQEALKSTEEEYYDFLALQGITQRPTLNYRTLSDSVWIIGTETKTFTDEDGNEQTVEEPLAHPWQHNNLGKMRTLWQPQTTSENGYLRGVPQGVFLKIYGPEWYNSFNTAAPYGQNDGALWQGKGYNTSLTAGARLEGYGLELTLKPQVSFSQNMGFELLPQQTDASGIPIYDSPYAYFWGYGKNSGVDAPQRFGNKPFFTFDWSDTEVRYSWRTLTVGFGTQAIWLGPARLNPLLHSNNAPSYPKFDIGLRRQRIVIPKLGWYLGDIEGRIWIGQLSESAYFDNDTSNDHNMIHGLSIAYSPSFIPGLTIGANRVCLVKWKWENLKYLIPKSENTDIGVAGAGEDQKMSITVDWLFPKVGFEAYGEIGVDDYAHSGRNLHTYTYTVGVKKNVNISKKYGVFAEIIFEWNNTEMSQDFQFQWPYNFGFHYQITQGYTNCGQWLGSGLGYGGNSQFLGANIYFPKGKIFIFFQRANPDNNYVYSQAIKTSYGNELNSYKSVKSYGGVATYFVLPSFSISVGVIGQSIGQPYYSEMKERWMGNWQIQLFMKYNI